MSSEIITSNDLKKILASAFPARANTTITNITLPYTPPCNGLFIGMLRAAAQGRAYKQFSNVEPSLWDFYQVAGGYSTFASFAKAGKQIAETATTNINASDAIYYFFVPLDGTSPLFGGSVDTVIEQGTSGIWTYRKWSSGIAECWGTYTGTTSYTANAAASGGYRTIISGIALPFTFSAAPKATASHSGTDSHYCGSVANVTTSTTEVGVTLDRGNAVSNGAISITFNVIGTWK